MANEDDKHRLIIGIDYGTTYTGTTKLIDKGYLTDYFQVSHTLTAAEKRSK
jgi:hypothetical protein